MQRLWTPESLHRLRLEHVVDGIWIMYGELRVSVRTDSEWNVICFGFGRHWQDFQGQGWNESLSQTGNAAPQVSCGNEMYTPRVCVNASRVHGLATNVQLLGHKQNEASRCNSRYPHVRARCVFAHVSRLIQGVQPPL